jgi:carbamoyltransferase
MRIGPQNPRLGKAVFRLALPWIDHFYRSRQIFRANSTFAQERFRALRAKLARGEPLYIGGICASGTHNTGVALIEVTPESGPKLICNNEEERFSGERHTMRFPHLAVEALIDLMRRRGIAPERIDAWLGAWDNAAHAAAMLRALAEEAPASLWSLRVAEIPGFNLRQFSMGTRAARILGRQFGGDQPVTFITTPHHDNHAWFSFCVSPFARSDRPVMIAVFDGAGDVGAISLYAVKHGRMHQLRCNDSLFDSLGHYYTIISSTQGGWTWLSSEGRYMGAAAWGDDDRRTNPFYKSLKEIISLRPQGQIHINRDLANWHRSFSQPYTRDLIRILGEPIALKDMWNPDAVLRVEDIRHKENTQERLDKAAATQMVLEDGLIHVIDHLVRRTGGDQLVLTGGVALNAVANMRILEHFDETYYEREHGRRTRLHLWVPPMPNDAGVAVGAAYMGAYFSGAGPGASLQHAFYCGTGPSEAQIRAALAGASDVKFVEIGNVATTEGRNRVADLMAYMTARDGVIALFQGAAETGPRALGHRSILANPCNPRTRELLNSRVKYREAIRPLAPMMTRESAQLWFDLSDGASDDDYNAYNYMVLTAPAKPEARARIPAVIHADGTGRLQIVREQTDPLTHAYLKALGRRIEVAVNTSFNVGAPIAQTPVHAVETLRRSKGMDAVLMVAEEGPVFAMWHLQSASAETRPRFPEWFARWQAAN